MKNYQSAVTDLEQAVAGAKAQGAGKDLEMLGALAEAYAAVHAPKDKLNAIADELASLGKDAQGAGDGGAGLLPRRQRRARDGGAQRVAGDRAGQRGRARRAGQGAQPPRRRRRRQERARPA